MKDLCGKYVGLMPVADSATGFGEYEITVTERLVKFRTATGKGIVNESLFAAGFKRMTEEEVGQAAEVDGDPDDHEITGYRHSTGTPTFCYARQKSSGLGVLFLISDGLMNLLGPIALFDERSMKQFEIMLAEIEKNGGTGTTPRLASRGCAPRSDLKAN